MQVSLVATPLAQAEGSGVHTFDDLFQYCCVLLKYCSPLGSRKSCMHGHQTLLSEEYGQLVRRGQAAISLFTSLKY
jgi:hypothetical protein